MRDIRPVIEFVEGMAAGCATMAATCEASREHVLNVTVELTSADLTDAELVAVLGAEAEGASLLQSLRRCRDAIYKLAASLDASRTMLAERYYQARARQGQNTDLT